MKGFKSAQPTAVTYNIHVCILTENLLLHNQYFYFMCILLIILAYFYFDYYEVL